MVKIGLHSDMHLELQKQPNDWLTQPADIVVLAGDQWKIDSAGSALSRLAKQYPKTDFIYVPGNHEFYDTGPMLAEESKLKQQIAHLGNVHFLQCSEVSLRGIRFLGCTGWSQMTSLGKHFQMDVMSTVKNGINDFYMITNSDGKRFSVHDCVRLGAEHREWLEEALSKHSSLPTVVITHFSPSLKFGNKNYPTSEISAYFCNDYDDLISTYQPHYWLYGHTHFNHNELLGSTRVISNQHGYGDECGYDYDPNFMFTIDVKPLS
jgi:Calcineurin-like phosphoesterase